MTDADGWIEWRGGECPVDPETRVEVMWGAQKICSSSRAWAFNWGPSGGIVAYRIVK